MRKVYLIRHGTPDFPQGKRLCLGKTDLPLSSLGRVQSCLLSAAAKEMTLSGIYCSELKRAVQTAEYLGDRVQIWPGLEETYAGVWDGLDFDEIRLRWPEVYERRGREPDFPIPGSESNDGALARFKKALTGIIGSSEGDIGIVTHRGVSVLLLRELIESGKRELEAQLPYCSVCELEYDKELEVKHIGLTPVPELTSELCRNLLRAYGCPERVISHCEAVAEFSAEIATALGLDAKLAANAGMLHDIARTEPAHDRTGAELLRKLGCPREAEIVGEHHMLSDCSRIDEAAVVFIADKMFVDNRRVSIEERFARSAAKCTADEAKRKHTVCLEQARQLKETINKMCLEELIK